MPQAFEAPEKRRIRRSAGEACASASAALAPAVAEREGDPWVESAHRQRSEPRIAEDLAEIWCGAWKPETWAERRWVRLVVTFVALAVFSYFGILLSRASDGVATIWLTNGILFGIVITRPRREWLGYFLVGLTADTLADIAYGDPGRLAFGVSVANSVEVVTSSVLLSRWFGTPLNLSRRRPLLGFLGVAVVGAAALTSALGATWTILFGSGGGWLQMFRTWYLGDILGMAILGPLVFMLQRPGFFANLRRRELAHTLPVLAVPAISALLVFTQDRDPLIFFLFPGLLLVVFRLGFPGTVLTILMMALLAMGFTVSGHGPLMLIMGEHMLPHRIMVVQVFLAVAIFTSFPVAALLEEREALQVSLLESEARQRRLANSDELTGLSNRRAFNLRLEQEWSGAAQRGDLLGLLLLDADLFKSYNDIYGHVGGDECLRCIASVIAESMEGGLATAARFGGEEFAVILPTEETGRAAEVAESIRQKIARMSLPHAGSPEGVQTVSIGVAILAPKRGMQVMELITLADRALYRAKDLGRNRVVVA